MSIKVKKVEFDLSIFFNSDNDPEMLRKRKEVERESYGFIDKWKNREDYLDEPSILKEALDEYEKWRRHFGLEGDEGYYFYLRAKKDGNNSELKAKLNKIHDFGNKIMNDIMFFELKLAKISLTKQKQFLEESILKDYRFFLERLFKQAQYLLSEPEEKILNLKSIPAHENWIKMVSGFLSEEEAEVIVESGRKERKNFSELLSLAQNKDKKIRDFSANVLNNIFIKYAPVAENELNSILYNKKINDELRGYDRPDKWRHVGDDMETEVVDALIEAVSNRFDISHKFYKLKAKLLGLEKLEYYERNVQYGEIEKKYSYEDGLVLVYKVFNRLDNKFSSILSDFNNNGCIDVYPCKGKESGASCSYNLISQPTYILLNYTDKLEDVLTLAHEVGHGINNELSKEKQHSLYFGTSTATAEVASIFMEDFVLEEILKEADDELKLVIMMRKLDDCINSVFRQVALYKFEQELHNDFKNKGYLSKKEIGELFKKRMTAYLGEDIVWSPGYENWWVYWSHIRMFFYTYSYASGLLVSKSLQKAVKRDHKFIEKIKEFLASGASNTPRNIFLKLGIDIAKKEFWDDGLSGIELLLDETVKLAKKLRKI